MKSNTKNTIKIYWKQVVKYKISLFFVIFSIVLAASVGSIIPIYFKKFFDLLVSGESIEIVYNKLLSVLLMIAILEVLRQLFWRANMFINSHFQTKVIANLDNNSFEHIHKHSFTFFNNNFGGSLVKKVNYFSRAFEDIADNITFNIITLMVNVSVVAIVLFFKSFFLGIAIISWVLVYIAINSFFVKYRLKYDIKANEAQTEATGVLADTITNNSNVKLFNGYRREVNNFFSINNKVRKIRKYSWNLENYFETVQSILMIVLEIGFFYIGIKLWRLGKFSVGDFVLLQSYILIVMMQIWNIGRVIRRIYQKFADAAEMTEILTTPYEIKDVGGAKKLSVSKGQIDFVDVDFYYHKTRKVLNKLNLSIRSNERIALIGPSGAGKSTIIKLLLRQHEVSGGKILIDSQKINKVTQDSLWKNISLVPQDPILFHRSLMENIRYGKPEATNSEVIGAAKLAHCDEFIRDLPEKYNTYVGERGVKLSGGERQRVAIARAILRNAPILILDEATSSLDSGSESMIQNALEKLMKDKTVIVIAHRLSTIRRVDRIIFVDEGIIKEEGTHDELIKLKNGHYNRLWEMQAGGFIG